jgi:CheY-like chemotaxis protein
MNQHRAVPCERSEDMTLSLASTRVLIAHADADMRVRHRDAFVRAGCEVVEATDGRDALVKAFAAPLSFVVAELALPFVDGHALCEILRRDPMTAAVPILLVAPNVRSGDVRRLGVACVLVKPALDDVVQQGLQRVAEVRASQAQSARARTHATALRDKSADLIVSSTGRCRAARANADGRFTTASPSLPPPALTCPSCDRALRYEHSHVGGVNDRHLEQWDYFVCGAGCGVFQYRQRTRKVRRVRNAHDPKTARLAG